MATSRLGRPSPSTLAQRVAPTAERLRRWTPSRRFLLVLAGAASAAILALTLPTTIALAQHISPGCDFALYRDAAARWLAGGEFYTASQLAGPYVLAHGAILYPPVALWLFAPFTVLPPVLWWAIPAALVGWSLWRIRPDPLAWPVMAFLIGFSPLPVLIRAGNPSLWIIAAMFAGCATVGPTALVLLKPSLAPFALFRVWRRRWWLWAAAFGLACLPFGAMWLDWAQTMLNSSAPWWYSFREVGLLLVPVVASAHVPAFRAAWRPASLQGAWTTTTDDNPPVVV